MITSFRRVRHLQRYHKIVSVLARHGFGSFLESIQVHRYLPLPLTLLKQAAQPASVSPGEHFRMALEELGPTFIKLGQILSTRPDVFPPEFIVELSKLQDGVPPTPWEAVAETLQQEYARDPLELFTEIEQIPLGSASLAQVHAAALPDGSRVVLKVQRPNILHTINEDLDILTDLANLAQRTPWGRLYNPVEIVAQFAYTLHNELDYRQEGLNADRFRTNFSTDCHLYIPKIHWDYCTARVLVMERIEGIKIDHLEALDAAGYDRHKIAVTAAGILVQEIMEDGFFHADPHPGNFFVMAGADGSDIILGGMDFGMVGHLSKVDRINLLQTYMLADRQDTHALVEHLLRMGAVTGQVDLPALEREVDRVLFQYRGIQLKHVDFRNVLEEMMQLSFRYRIVLPSELWLLFKTLMMVDGLARRLDPEVDIFEMLSPKIRFVLAQMHMPWVWGPSFLNDLESLAFVLKDIPSMGENLLRSLQKGELPFSFNMGANKETLDRLDRITTRLSLTLLVSAFILGLALLLPVAAGNQIAVVLVAIGFVAAVLLGVWVFVSIIKTGR